MLAWNKGGILTSLWLINFSVMFLLKPTDGRSLNIYCLTSDIYKKLNEDVQVRRCLME